MHPDDAPVVLLDADRHPIRQLPKSHGHHAATPLHLAFSCYVFDAWGRVLMTRRATTGGATRNHPRNLPAFSGLSGVIQCD